MRDERLSIIDSHVQDLSLEEGVASEAVFASAA
jgi:hypothetical protein